MTQELYLISEVAHRLDVPKHRIAYLLMTRKLDEPKLRMGNRRVFTNEDARRVAHALGLTWVSATQEGRGTTDRDGGDK